ncbi:MAG: leucyl/phenylalanyl-tRNA--protein transferase, partial [Enhydrobacter sp.]
GVFLPQDAADNFHLQRRLARTVRSGSFEVSADTDFAATVRACAEPRPGHPESWINDPIVELFSELHRRGHAHSIECRIDGALVGGLYGAEACLYLAVAGFAVQALVIWMSRAVALISQPEMACD